MACCGYAVTTAPPAAMMTQCMGREPESAAVAHVPHVALVLGIGSFFGCGGANIVAGMDPVLLEVLQQGSSIQFC